MTSDNVWMVGTDSVRNKCRGVPVEALRALIQFWKSVWCSSVLFHALRILHGISWCLFTKQTFRPGKNLPLLLVFMVEGIQVDSRRFSKRFRIFFELPWKNAGKFEKYSTTFQIYLHSCYRENPYYCNYYFPVGMFVWLTKQSGNPYFFNTHIIEYPANQIVNEKPASSRSALFVKIV